MNIENEDIHAIAATTSVIVAIVALFRAALVEKRAQKLSREQLMLSEHQLEVSKRLIRPILGIYTSDFTTYFQIELKNKGAGTAIVTKLQYSRDGKIKSSIPSLVQGSPRYWSKYWKASEGGLLLDPHESVCLVKLSIENLKDEAEGEEAQKSLLKKTKQSLRGIKIECDYTDVLDQKQDSISVILEM